MNSFCLKDDANLKGYWKLEGNANDETGNYNGTATNLTYGLSYGKFGQGLITTANPSGMSINKALTGTIGTGDFGITFWFNPKAPPANHYPALFSSFQNSEPNFVGPTIFFDPLNVSGKGNGILFRTTKANETHFITSPSASSLYNIWTNIVFTRLSGTCYVYYNGVEKTNWVDSVNIPTSDYVYFCGRSTLDIQSFSGGSNTGKMDDVAYLNRGLTATEAQAIYSCGMFSTQRGLLTFAW